mgnify:CR=1 FL=1
MNSESENVVAILLTLLSNFAPDKQDKRYEKTIT